MPFFCLWIPQFAAFALSQTNQNQTQPALASTPFIVCERECVVAASPLAIQVGVVTDMALGKALSKSPDLLAFARDRNCEALVWAELQRLLYGLTPQIEAVQAGLLFADLDAKAAAPLLGHWAKGDWGVHGGQATDRATAQLAALQSRCGEVCAVPLKRERDFIDLTPLSVLKNAGVHPKSLQRMRWFGWEKVGQLRRLTRRQLEEQLQKPAPQDGLTLYRFAQGPLYPPNRREVPNWQPPEELFATIEFEVAAREPAHWDAAMDELLREVCAGLGTRQAQTLELCAHTPVAPVVARRVFKEPLANPRVMRRVALSALEEALRILHPLPPVVLRLEIRLGGLTNAPVQETLFEDESATNSRRLGSVLRHLQTRVPDRVGHYVSSHSESPFIEERYSWLSALESLQQQSSQQQHNTSKAVAR